MPPKKIKQRNLPEERNASMLGEQDASALASKCRVQDVKFNRPDDDQAHTETFVRIKTQRPGFETPHFIMRKAADDYISATSMFRSVFHKATSAQERLEMDIIARELRARDDEFASGVWVPAEDALKLADVYGIRPWIVALLDASSAKSTNTPLSSRGGATTADRHTPISPSSSGSAAAVAAPQSIPPAAAKRARSPARKTNQAAALAQAASLAAPTSATTTTTNITNSDGLVPKVEIASPSKPSAAPVPSKKIDGGSAADELAIAKAQVQAAQRKDAEALAKSGVNKTTGTTSAAATGSAPATASKPRRKRTRAEVEDDDDVIAAADAEQIPSAKRARVIELERVVLQERRKVRALVGLVLGLGATAILPYVL